MMALVRATILLYLCKSCLCLHTADSERRSWEISGRGSLITSKRSQSLLRYVASPKSLLLADMQKEQIDTSAMDKTQLIVPGTPEEVAIFVYQSSMDDAFVSEKVKESHTWETDHVQKLVDLWKAGSRGNFLDVGGNIGTFVLPISHYISQFGAQAGVIEGMPSIAKYLKASIVTNELDNIALYQYAVGGPDKQDSVEMAENPENKGGSAVVGNKPWTVEGDYYGHPAPPTEVGLTTIDAILDGNAALQKLLAMKMDIEGNEGRALSGAKKLLANYPPCYLMIELSPDWLGRAGTPCESVKQQLTEANYDTSSITCEHIDTYFLAQHDMETCLARCKA